MKEGELWAEEPYRNDELWWIGISNDQKKKCKHWIDKLMVNWGKDDNSGLQQTDTTTEN